MIMPVLGILAVWSVSLLEMTHVIRIMDPVNALLLAAAVTVCSIRLSVRKRETGSKKKILSI